MRELRLFTIQLNRRTGLFDDGPLREWLAVRELLSVQSAFFVHDGLPTWSLAVEARPLRTSASALPSPPAADPGPVSKPRAEANTPTPEELAFREALAAADELTRARYDRLLVFRRDVSRAEGIPPYVLFTNQVAFELARRSPATLSAMAEIRGFGRKRLEKHGRLILEVLHGPAASAPTSRPDAADAEPQGRTLEAAPLRALDGHVEVAAEPDRAVPEEGPPHTLAPD